MIIDNENDFDIIYFERKKYNICPQFTAKCLDTIVYRKNLFSSTKKTKQIIFVRKLKVYLHVTLLPLLASEKRSEWVPYPSCPIYSHRRHW